VDKSQSSAGGAAGGIGTLQGWEHSGFRLQTLEVNPGVLSSYALTYPVLTPYLKGLHLTLDSWRPGRDEEGWKISSGLAGTDDDSLWV
jgi:hypothetical protein